MALVNKTLLELQAEKKDFSSNQIKKEIFQSIENTSFFEVAEDFLDELEKSKKLARLSSDKARINHIKKFSKSKHLTFPEIDEAFLRRFKNYLRAKRDLSDRSIANNLIVIRTLYNRAIKLGIVKKELYPFGSNKIQIKFPETEKIGLTKEEVKKLESVEDLTKDESHARNVWLFSFYFAGIRIADVIKIRWSDIYDDRLHYRMNKNAKLLSLKIPEKARQILNYYLGDKRSKDDFIFPELKNVVLKDSKSVFTKTKSANKKLNNYMQQVAKKAGINKKVTMHIARHSFGNISEDKIPIKMLQKLYRHSSISTTIIYQSNFMHKDVDEALDNVVNF